MRINLVNNSLINSNADFSEAIKELEKFTNKTFF